MESGDFRNVDFDDGDDFDFEDDFILRGPGEFSFVLSQKQVLSRCV